MGRHLGYLGWSQRLSEVLQVVGHASNSWNVIVESGSLPVSTLCSTKVVSPDEGQMLSGSQPHSHCRAALVIRIHYEKNNCTSSALKMHRAKPSRTCQKDAYPLAAP